MRLTVIAVRTVLLAGGGFAGLLHSVSGAAAEASAPNLDTVLVIATRDNRTSSGATGLDLGLARTPQSVTVVDREFMDDFALDDINEVLNLTTGVNVEEVETDRTYYNSRGFDIKSMQVDGIGTPFTWNVVGAVDTFTYDRVEVIRGANGLLTGTGNPSGTINYVRKRPTNEFAASTELSFGSWNRRRLEADVSGPLTDSRQWAGRLLVAGETKDSHLDLYGSERLVISGMVDGQIGDFTTLTLGFTQQDHSADGVLWGALPMLYDDGTQTSFDPSSTTSMDWTYWDTTSRTAFAEAVFALPADWQIKTVVTWNDYEEPSELFYIYASPTLERATGLGLWGWPGAYTQVSERKLLDITATGSFDLGGRAHDLLLGFSGSRADSKYFEYPAAADDPAWGALPAFPGWTGTEINRPAFGEKIQQSDWYDEVMRVYGVAGLHPTAALDVILGFNAIDVQSEGTSFGEPMNRDEQAVSPYIGVVYQLPAGVNVYASYSDIYEPQGETDAELKPLGAAVGESWEAGLKGEWFDRRLYASAALFKAEQDNYAEWAGYNVDGISYYEGTDLRSEGFELEVAGRIAAGWTIQAGYTQLTLRDPQGDDARTFIPRETLTLATRYAVPFLPALELGATLKWQDDIHLEAAGGLIRQEAFAVASLAASYDFTERMQLAVNVNNVTDETYLASLYWDQAFYGAPRNFMARLTVDF